MTKLQAIRSFTTYVLGEYCGIARERMYDNWGMVVNRSTPYIRIPKNLDYETDHEDIAFRENFVKRCPIAEEFSNEVLTILHECGHWATRSVMDQLEYEESISRAYTQELYMANPWEMLATQWAICWLLCPVNREQAHKFEKEYFGE